MKHIFVSVAAMSIVMATCSNPDFEGTYRSAAPPIDQSRKEPPAEPCIAAEAQITGPESVRAEPEDFPATCVFRSDNLAPCTCVLVGSRALLTAAHCVGKSGKGEIERNDRKHTGTCTRAPGFMANPPDKTADLALCRMDPEIASVKFERLAATGETLTENGELLLTGFGCEHRFFPSEEGGLRKAISLIKSLPTTDNFIRMGGESDLCFGDSGGPAYLLFSAEHAGPRRVVAVNAESGPSLASVTTVTAKEFITAWAAGETGAPICGISENAQNCRD